MKYFLFQLLIICKIFFIKTEKDIFDQFKNLRFCGADLIKNNLSKYNNFPKPKNNKKRSLSTDYRPIRIYLETTHFEEQAAKEPFFKEKLPLLKEAINRALNGIRSLIQVEDTNKNYFNNVTSIFKDNKVEKWNPVFDRGEDIKSDFLLVVRFANVREFPNGVLAAAVPIKLDEETNRPLIGLLIIAIETSFYSYNRVMEYFSEVFLHELTHALGFLEGMFPFYPGGLSATLGSKIIRRVNRTLMITPTVVTHAKKYFNCPSIEGVELEDQGGPGSSVSHWEQRILLGEYMGAVIYQEEMVISEFTLAALEDSGWYKVNYYTGGLMRFGKNKGCKFLDEPCLNNTLQTEFENEFFNYEYYGYPSCSAGRQSRTYSTLNNYIMIDNLYYTNFRYDPRFNNYYSGSIYTADYCFTHGQFNSECTSSYFTGNCKYGNGNYGQNIYYYNNDIEGEQDWEFNHPNGLLPKELGEKYSNTSFCVMSSLVPTGKYKMYGTVFHPMCYQMLCSSSSLTIQINDDYIVCPREGGNVELVGYDGQLHCPDYNLICTGTVLCNDMFDCIDKKSEPKSNTYEYEYEPKTTQNYFKLGNMESSTTAYELSDDGICPLHCSQCSKNKRCKKCRDGYYLLEIKKDGVEQIICNETRTLEDKEKLLQNGYFIGDYGAYYLCSDSCGSCKGSKNNCSTCNTDYYFLENSNSCYKESDNPKGLYFNPEKKVFIQCYQNCETCSTSSESPEIMNCDTCKEGLVYDEKTKNCNPKSNTVIIVIIVILVIILLAGIGAGVYLIYKMKTKNKSNLEFKS